MSRALIFHCNECRKVRRPFVKETNFRHHLIRLHKFTKEHSIRQVDQQRREFFRRNFSKPTNVHQIRPSVIVQPQSRIAPKSTPPEIITISDDDDEEIASNANQQTKCNLLEAKTFKEVSNFNESLSTFIQLNQCSSKVVRQDEECIVVETTIQLKPSIQPKESQVQVQHSEHSTNINVDATSHEEQFVRQQKRNELEKNKMLHQTETSVNSITADETQNPDPEEEITKNGKKPQLEGIPTLSFSIPIVARQSVKPQLYLVNDYFSEKRLNNVTESSKSVDCYDLTQLSQL